MSDFYIPTKLLSTNNAKTIKGEKRGWTTYIMYLAPAAQNDFGVNLCSHSSAGCRAACLFHSGNARFNHVQLGKINKANYRIKAEEQFMLQLYDEIKTIVRLHGAMTSSEQYGRTGKLIRQKQFAIRLNGSADILFERIPVIDGKNLFELFPEVQFYDYTKVYRRFYKELPNNYHLTFSLHEDNAWEAFKLLKKGYNVAMVFGIKKTEAFPITYKGYRVIDGDNDDLRFLDDDNVIIGLRYKNVVSKGNSGVNKHKFDSGFVIKI